MKRFLLLLVFPCMSMSMEKNVPEAAATKRELYSWEKSRTYATRDFYFPGVAVAQTEDGNTLAVTYFNQLKQWALPCGLPFEHARIYWSERANCDISRIIPGLKEYTHRVLSRTFFLRNPTLAKDQTGVELITAINEINNQINQDDEQAEKWLQIKWVLNGYHEKRNQIIAGSEGKKVFWHE